MDDEATGCLRRLAALYYSTPLHHTRASDLNSDTAESSPRLRQSSTFCGGGISRSASSLCSDTGGVIRIPCSYHQFEYASAFDVLRSLLLRNVASQRPELTALVGPPGCGKTFAALQLARLWADDASSISGGASCCSEKDSSSAASLSEGSAASMASPYDTTLPCGKVMCSAVLLMMWDDVPSDAASAPKPNSLAAAETFVSDIIARTMNVWARRVLQGARLSEFTTHVEAEPFTASQVASLLRRSGVVIILDGVPSGEDDSVRRILQTFKEVCRNILVTSRSTTERTRTAAACVRMHPLPLEVFLSVVEDASSAVPQSFPTVCDASGIGRLVLTLPRVIRSAVSIASLKSTARCLNATAVVCELLQLRRVHEQPSETLRALCRSFMVDVLGLCGGAAEDKWSLPQRCAETISFAHLCDVVECDDSHVFVPEDVAIVCAGVGLLCIGEARDSGSCTLRWDPNVVESSIVASRLRRATSCGVQAAMCFAWPCERTEQTMAAALLKLRIVDTWLLANDVFEVAMLQELQCAACDALSRRESSVDANLAELMTAYSDSGNDAVLSELPSAARCCLHMTAAIRLLGAAPQSRDCITAKKPPSRVTVAKFLETAAQRCRLTPSLFPPAALVAAVQCVSDWLLFTPGMDWDTVRLLSEAAVVIRLDRSAFSKWHAALRELSCDAATDVEQFACIAATLCEYQAEAVGVALRAGTAADGKAAAILKPLQRCAAAAIATAPSTVDAIWWLHQLSTLLWYAPAPLESIIPALESAARRLPPVTAPLWALLALLIIRCADCCIPRHDVCETALVDAICDAAGLACDTQSAALGNRCEDVHRPVFLLSHVVVDLDSKWSRQFHCCFQTRLRHASKCPNSVSLASALHQLISLCSARHHALPQPTRLYGQFPSLVSVRKSLEREPILLQTSGADLCDVHDSFAVLVSALENGMPCASAVLRHFCDAPQRLLECVTQSPNVAEIALRLLDTPECFVWLWRNAFSTSAAALLDWVCTHITPRCSLETALQLTVSLLRTDQDVRQELLSPQWQQLWISSWSGVHQHKRLRRALSCYAGQSCADPWLIDCAAEVASSLFAPHKPISSRVVREVVALLDDAGSGEVPRAFVAHVVAECRTYGASLASNCPSRRRCARLLQSCVRHLNRDVVECDACLDECLELVGFWWVDSLAASRERGATSQSTFDAALTLLLLRAAKSADFFRNHVALLATSGVPRERLAVVRLLGSVLRSATNSIAPSAAAIIQGVLASLCDDASSSVRLLACQTIAAHSAVLLPIPTPLAQRIIQCLIRTADPANPTPGALAALSSLAAMTSILDVESGATVIRNVVCVVAARWLPLCVADSWSLVAPLLLVFTAAVGQVNKLIGLCSPASCAGFQVVNDLSVAVRDAFVFMRRSAGGIEQSCLPSIAEAAMALQQRMVSLHLNVADSCDDQRLWRIAAATDVRGWMWILEQILTPADDSSVQPAAVQVQCLNTLKNYLSVVRTARVAVSHMRDISFLLRTVMEEIPLEEVRRIAAECWAECALWQLLSPATCGAVGDDWVNLRTEIYVPREPQAQTGSTHTTELWGLMRSSSSSRDTITMARERKRLDTCCYAAIAVVWMQHIQHATFAPNNELIDILADVALMAAQNDAAPNTVLVLHVYATVLCPSAGEWVAINSTRRVFLWSLQSVHPFMRDSARKWICQWLRDGASLCSDLALYASRLWVFTVETQHDDERACLFLQTVAECFAAKLDEHTAVDGLTHLAFCIVRTHLPAVAALRRSQRFLAQSLLLRLCTLFVDGSACAESVVRCVLELATCLLTTSMLRKSWEPPRLSCDDIVISLPVIANDKAGEVLSNKSIRRAVIANLIDVAANTSAHQQLPPELFNFPSLCHTELSRRSERSHAASHTQQCDPAAQRAALNSPLHRVRSHTTLYHIAATSSTAESRDIAVVLQLGFSGVFVVDISAPQEVHRHAVSSQVDADCVSWLLLGRFGDVVMDHDASSTVCVYEKAIDTSDALIPLLVELAAGSWSAASLNPRERILELPCTHLRRDAVPPVELLLHSFKASCVEDDVAHIVSDVMSRLVRQLRASALPLLEDPYRRALADELRMQLHGLYSASVVVASGVVANSKTGSLGKAGKLLCVVGAAVPIVGGVVAAVGSALGVVDCLAQQQRLTAIRRLAVSEGDASVFFALLATAVCGSPCGSEDMLQLAESALDGVIDKVDAAAGAATRMLSSAAAPSEQIGARLRADGALIAGRTVDDAARALLRHAALLLSWIEEWLAEHPVDLSEGPENVVRRCTAALGRRRALLSPSSKLPASPVSCKSATACCHQ